MKTKPSADVDTDHMLLWGKIKWKLRRLNNSERQQVKWNIQDIKCQNIQQKYEVTMSNRFEALIQEDLDVDELTQHAAKVITEMAEVLENTPKKAKKKWISNETMQLIERKRQLRNQRKRSPEYSDLKRDVQNALRKDKQERLEEKCTSRRNESKTQYWWCIQDDKRNNWEKMNATDGH